MVPLIGGLRKLRRRMTGRTWLLAALIALVPALVLAAFLTRPEPAVEPGSNHARLSILNGRASVYRVRENWLGVERRMPQLVRAGGAVLIGADESVVLDAGSYARLTLLDGSTVELYPGTALRLSSLHIAPGTYDVGLNIVSGTIINHVQPLPGADARYAVSTPASEVSVRGTVFTVKVVDPHTTHVNCTEGEVLVMSDTGQSVVAAGQSVVAVAEGPIVAAATPPPAPSPTPIQLEPGEYPTPRPPEMVPPVLADVYASLTRSHRAGGPSEGQVAAGSGVSAPPDLPAPLPEPAQPVSAPANDPPPAEQPPADDPPPPPAAPPPDAPPEPPAEEPPPPPDDGDDGDDDDRDDDDDDNRGRGNDNRGRGNDDNPGRGNDDDNRGRGNDDNRGRGNEGRGNGGEGRGRGNGGRGRGR